MPTQALMKPEEINRIEIGISVLELRCHGLQTGTRTKALNFIAPNPQRVERARNIRRPLYQFLKNANS